MKGNSVRKANKKRVVNTAIITAITVCFFVSCILILFYVPTSLLEGIATNVKVVISIVPAIIASVLSSRFFQVNTKKLQEEEIARIKLEIDGIDSEIEDLESSIRIHNVKSSMC